MPLVLQDGDSETFFAWPRSDAVNVPLKPGGHETALTYATRLEWCELLLASRCKECEEQVRAVRRGIGQLVPVGALGLFSVEELERLVCGESDWAPSRLRRNAQIGEGPTLKSMISSHDRTHCGEPLGKRYPPQPIHLTGVRTELANWLFEFLGECTAEERRLFLQFVWGRSRMPSNLDPDARENQFKVSFLHLMSACISYRSGAARCTRDMTCIPFGCPQSQIASKDGNDEMLPLASTCFFELKLPPYTTKAALVNKLTYAIYNCTSMEMA